MKNRFQFYEVVTIVDSHDVNIQTVVGKEGTILGMSQDEESSHWSYAVSIASICEVWHFEESQLKSTGTTQNPADYYTGESVKVNVDPKTGEGSLGGSTFPDSRP